jgi:hypothetical protein
MIGGTGMGFPLGIQHRDACKLEAAFLIAEMA